MKINLIFYGNGFIPLSEKCDYCHNFNYLCEGSIYRNEGGHCPAGEFDYCEDSKVAIELLSKINYNNYLLALIIGAGDKEDLKKHLITLKGKENSKAIARMIKKCEEAINSSEKFINDFRRKNNIEI